MRGDAIVGMEASSEGGQQSTKGRGGAWVGTQKAPRAADGGVQLNFGKRTLQQLQQFPAPAPMDEDTVDEDGISIHGSTEDEDDAEPELMEEAPPRPWSQTPGV